MSEFCIIPNISKMSLLIRRISALIMVFSFSMKPVNVEYTFDLTRPYKMKWQGVRSGETAEKATYRPLQIKLFGGLIFK